jgi:hypothetical protein
MRRPPALTSVTQSALVGQAPEAGSQWRLRAGARDSLPGHLFVKRGGRRLTQRKSGLWAMATRITPNYGRWPQAAVSMI